MQVISLLKNIEQIKAMAVRYKTTEEGMKYKLKRKFDGYHFSPNMLNHSVDVNSWE